MTLLPRTAVRGDIANARRRQRDRGTRATITGENARRSSATTSYREPSTVSFPNKRPSFGARVLETRRVLSAGETGPRDESRTLLASNDFETTAGNGKLFHRRESLEAGRAPFRPCVLADGYSLIKSFSFEASRAADAKERVVARLRNSSETIQRNGFSSLEFEGAVSSRADSNRVSFRYGGRTVLVSATIGEHWKRITRIADNNGGPNGAEVDVGGAVIAKRYRTASTKQR